MTLLALTHEPDFGNPLLWAVMIGWIFTVVLHEFAHGLVAYMGGDYTIRQRGGLTLNPFQYIHPVMSILLPIVYLAMGGIPLPGGATYIRNDLLRNKYWQAAASAAGPAMNLLIFLVLCLVLSKHVGWINPDTGVERWTNAQKFVGALALLQIFSVLLNLLPIPTLDGFGIISPFLPLEPRLWLAQPQVRNTMFFGFIFLMWTVPSVFYGLFSVCDLLIDRLGLDPDNLHIALQLCLWGS